MVLMFEKDIRGVSMISKRYAKANNPYMGEDDQGSLKYDPDKPIKYIPYLDANHLFG